MAGYHTVKQGECLASLSEQYGFVDYKKIYNDEKNSKLRELRPNPNIVYPGDEVYIPDRKTKTASRGTDQTHRFVLKKPKVLLRLVLQGEDGKPSSAKYNLRLRDKATPGETGPDGVIEREIPCDLQTAELEVTFSRKDGDPITRKWTLMLGHLNPPEEPTGIQARLNNLGYYCGDVDGDIGSKTESAVRAFQEDAGLTVDGIAGPLTQAKLRAAHGC